MTGETKPVERVNLIKVMSAVTNRERTEKGIRVFRRYSPLDSEVV